MIAIAKQRHRRHANPFTLRGPIAVPEWDTIFPRCAPFAVDVGCGAGRFVTDLAATHPKWNVLGLEIRQHLVDATLQAARRLKLSNAHAILANANSHLACLLPPASVVFVSINFPDPWYKKRHHKRRVVGAEWLRALSEKLAPGAEIHAMSDYQPIAEEMYSVLVEQPGFTCLHGAGGFAESSTTGLTTEREIKHLRRNEQIYRMAFVYGLARREEVR